MTVALFVCALGVRPLPVSGVDSDLRLSPAERLRRELAACAAVVDVSAYGLSPAEVGRMYAVVLQDDPALFHVLPRLAYTERGGVVGSLYPAYSLEGEALFAARDGFRATMAACLADFEAAVAGEPYTQAEVALFIHDWLAARVDYDVRAMANPTAGNRDAYRLFAEGVGVCQAYALATMALLRAAGLEADFVSSPAMDHAWVHVRVDGVWYHMDVTRDDPVAVHSDGSAASAGRVTHERVLRSDAGMASLGYHDFSCAGGHRCTDARYESAAVMEALSAVSSPFVAVRAEDGASLVWVGERADGALAALSVADAGGVAHAPWDIDGDGVVTAGDLLVLRDADVPEAWRMVVRRMLVGDDVSASPK